MFTPKIIMFTPVYPKDFYFFSWLNFFVSLVICQPS